MFLSVIVFFLFFIFLIRDFEDTFISLLVLSSLLMHFQLLGADVFTYLSIISCLLFYYKRIKLKYKNSKKLPVQYSMVFITISLMVSGVVINTSPLFVSTITNIIRDVILVYIFWIILNNRKTETIRIFYRTALVFGAIIVLYTVFESITGLNPYVEFVNYVGAYKEDTIITDERYGFKRCQSFFSMHTSCGGVIIQTICPLLYLLKYTNDYKNSVLFFLFLPLMVYACLATGARSAIVGCVICLMIFVKLRMNFVKFSMVLLLITIFMYIVMSFDFSKEVYNSIVEPDSITGSNEDMRNIQFAIGLQYWAKSFLFGNGLFAWTEITKHTDLLGAESMWLPLMIDRGLLGIIAYLLLIVNMIVYSIRMHKNELFFFVIGYVIFNSLSSIPMVNFSYLFVCISIMIFSTTPQNNYVAH